MDVEKVIFNLYKDDPLILNIVIPKDKEQLSLEVE